MASKFDFNCFRGGLDTFAVSKEKYSKKEAIECAKYQNDWHDSKRYIAIGTAFVRHRAGRNEDGEPCVGWWLEYEEHDRSCPVWCFHLVADPARDGIWAKDYEYIPIADIKESIKGTE